MGGRTVRVAIVSDIHYASAAEAQRRDYMFRGIHNPLARLLLKAYRGGIWLRDPFAHNHLLAEFIRRAETADFVVANGDYSCDSAFVGVSDDAACQSARECLDQLRRPFGTRFRASIGDHELGKASLGGGLGGPRLASLRRARAELGLETLWQIALGNYVLLGVTSSLAGWPVFEPETLPDERPEWRRLHEDHLGEIRRVFVALRPAQRVLLFCHDPTALPFLWRDEMVRHKLPQVEQTIIGHLHTKLVLWQSRVLAGLPVIRFLGTTPRRLSTALHEARHWRPFKVRLCPALTGIDLLKDGGFYTADLDLEAKRPARFQFHRMAR